MKNDIQILNNGKLQASEELKTFINKYSNTNGGHQKSVNVICDGVNDKSCHNYTCPDTLNKDGCFNGSCGSQLK